MKGIILAGGKGTRLQPMTRAINKHLLPVYNKPMIYYPLATLMLAQVRDILLITTGQDIDLFKRLLGDGSEYGARITYAVQDEPTGIPEAITIGANFVQKETFALILGDNIFFGAQLGARIHAAMLANEGATVFAHHVSNPSAYGVISFDETGHPLTLEEKPEDPKSNWAVTGLYIYGPDAVHMVKTIKPSLRGELEITDLNKLYMTQNRLQMELFARGYCWLDMGTPDNLMEATNYVRTIETRQGLMVCDPIEVGHKNGWL